MKVIKAARVSGILLRRRFRIGRRAYPLSTGFPNRVAIAVDSMRSREKWMTRVMCNAFEQRAGAFVDVGANVGQTLLKKLEIAPERPYIGFEPQLAACASIDDFLKRNDLVDHHIFPIALSDHFGTLTLGTSRNSDEGASVVSGFRPKEFFTSYRHVVVAPGDDVLQSIQIASTCLIKIDVEGGELEVLLGLQRKLSAQRPHVIFEVLPNYLQRFGKPLSEQTVAFRSSRLQQLTQLLADHSYTTFRVAKGGEWSPAKCKEIGVAPLQWTVLSLGHAASA